MIVSSFLIIIMAGTFLLLLPWASKEEPLSVIEALFTAVSATCVTGLTVIDIGSELTLFGQLSVLAMIQMGGLGIMTFSTFFLYILRKRISIRGKEVIDTTINYEPVKNLKVLLKKIFVVVASIEGFGIILLTLSFYRFYPLPKAIYHALFHSISAFCNAGFSLYSTSFKTYQFDRPINLILICLIISGGLGFIVLLDSVRFFRRSSRFRHTFSFHTKVVLLVTFILLLLGTVVLFVVEKGNALKDVSTCSGCLIAFFQSVTARTAGFNTISMNSLSNGSLLLIMGLMFFGAAPGSCGGGVKITTLGIFIALLVSRLKGHDEPFIFKRTISRETVGRVFTIVLTAVFIIGFFFFGLLLTENWAFTGRGSFIQLLFESVSAFGTVGLSTGITASLSTGGRILIILLMFIGRLGPLTMAVALTRPREKTGYRFAKGDIMIG
jgi:trk system potassium uptake protein TrkH